MYHLYAVKENVIYGDYYYHDGHYYSTRSVDTVKEWLNAAKLKHPNKSWVIVDWYEF